MPRKLTLLLILITFCLKAFPAVFVVTSNADSGPGTLRDALTQAAANGTAEKDYINFNIADISPAGRRINLITELPALTSNLVIDGSTQPGAVIGKSGAHIQLFTPVTFDKYTLFQGSELNDVEFYGLYMDDYTNGGVSDPDQKPRIGVNISNSSNIIFGAPGKGNLFLGFNTSTISLTNVDHVTFQSDVIGLGSNNTLSDPENLYLGAAGIYLSRCNNILIGGDTADDGNTIFTVFDIEWAQKSTNNNITIKWNNFAVYQDGKSIDFGFQDVTSLFLSTIGIDDYLPTDDVLANGAVVNADIENNVAGAFGNVIVITAINGEIDFYNNFLGISRDGTVNLDADSHADEGTQIRASNCRATINIGSNNPAKGNFLAYSTSTVSATNCPYILDRNNEYECIGFSDIYGDPITIYGNDNLKGTLPTISIDGVNNSNGQSVLNGKATPGSIVDIYGSESCTYSSCSIRRLIETVTTDANGAWKSDLINFSGNFYVSATKNNITSTFKTFDINIDKVVTTSIRCSGPGTITGIQFPTGATGHWVDNNGKIVSNDLVLVTNTPVDYQFVLGDGCIRSPFFHILDERVMILDFSLTTTDPSCGSQNGVISGLFAYDPENNINKTEWLDASGKVVSSSANINNLAAGSYTYKVFTSDGCEVDYGPVILKNTTGPNIDESAVKIQSTNCGQSTGSITNLTVTGTGTLQYAWMNAQQQTVGTDPNLINQPAGTYKLQVTDDTQCGPVYSSVFTIPETNGITIDSSKKVVTVASCGSNTGSITGIQVNGAASYKWTDANGSTLITTTPDILNVAAGIYTLTTSNEFGCILISSPIVIPLKLSTPLPVYTATYTNACNLQNNGAVAVATDGLVKSARWVDASGNTVGSGSSLTGVVAGTYKLYLTDQNGCENYYNSYTIQQYPEFTVSGYGNVTADACDLNSGAVDNTIIMGGIPPYTYTWTDANNKLIATTNAISNLAAGTYNLNVIDNGCGNVDITYTVTETTNIIAAPSVSDMQLCSSGSGIIVVNNASATATYRLYGGPSNTTPLDEEKGGRFNINSAGNQTYYVSEVSGSCESPRARLQVTVGLSSLNIANAFTPNGDGINDYWQVNNIQSYPDALVQIYNRYGQKLFESKGYVRPFDGTYNGQKLAAGVYYYIINLNNKCNILSGSLTLIR